MTDPTPMTPLDLDVVEAQLGRRPRGVLGCAHRCGCGKPAVIATAPQLDDGTPFPTTYYLTCPRLAADLSRVEASGVMQEMTARIADDPEVSAAYRSAHHAYLDDRRRFAEQAGIPIPDAIADTTAGGMPLRVKCLHALAGHALAAGAGVNPFGDEVLVMVGEWWQRPCNTEEEPCA